MGFRITLLVVVSCSWLNFQVVVSQQFNPTILQDTRVEPKVDGTFGFLYRTEDGITSAAKGDSNGVIHGRFSYTDPTGLKVNYNYNAGSRVAPGYNYKDAPEPSQQYDNSPPPRKYYDSPSPPQSKYYSPPRKYEEPKYYEPVEPAPAPQPIYRQPADVYQQRRTKPPPLRNNVNEDYNYGSNNRDNYRDNFDENNNYDNVDRRRF